MNETIKQDYFKLLRDLNKSNKTKNESTKLYFYINENHFFAALSEKQKVLLCENTSRIWYSHSSNLYPDLVTHIAKFLNKNQYANNLTFDLNLSIFQKFD